MENFPLSTKIIFIIIVVWSMIWKGLALWRSARKHDTIWYIVLLIINTAGILDIVYYFLVAKTDECIERKTNGKEM